MKPQLSACTVSGTVVQERYRHGGKHVEENKKGTHLANISQGNLKEFILEKRVRNVFQSVKSVCKEYSIQLFIMLTGKFNLQKKNKSKLKSSWILGKTFQNCQHQEILEQFTTRHRV